VNSEPAPHRRIAFVAVTVLAVAVVLWGGYSRRWPWTGINGHTATLWDWLHLLLLPMAAALVPVWLAHDTEVERRVKRVVLGAALALLVVALAGYLIPWAWTGFTGNTLWDWLNLVALPVAVGLAPLVPEIREGWGSRHSTVAMTVGAVFLAVVLAGYLIPWPWTGFTGNTLWDWLHLLLLPLLVPVVVVPALKSAAATDAKKS
jgi:hypothetical protein